MNRILVAGAAVLALIAAASPAQAATGSIYQPLPAGCSINGPVTVTPKVVDGVPQVSVNSPGVTCAPGSGYSIWMIVKARYKAKVGYGDTGASFWFNGVDGVAAHKGSAICIVTDPPGARWQGEVFFNYRSVQTHELVASSRFLSAGTAKCLGTYAPRPDHPRLQ